MNIPPETHPCWARAAQKGSAAFCTKQYALQMLLKRLEKSSLPTPAKAAALFRYFSKYQMILPSELAQLRKL